MVQGQLHGETTELLVAAHIQAIVFTRVRILKQSEASLRDIFSGAMFSSEGFAHEKVELPPHDPDIHGATQDLTASSIVQWYNSAAELLGSGNAVPRLTLSPA